MSEHIMITCPTANVPVRTGYRAAPGSGIEGLKRITLGKCPKCEEAHIWDGKDAYWVEYIPVPSRWDGFRERLRRSLNV
jgi:hypothetical protein